MISKARPKKINNKIRNKFPDLAVLLSYLSRPNIAVRLESEFNSKPSTPMMIISFDIIYQTV